MARLIEPETVEDRGEPVAYVDGNSYLIFRVDTVLSCAIYIGPDASAGWAPGIGEAGWMPDQKSVTRRFYKGDRITIEF